MEGYTQEYCWRKHPASLAQMSVDNTSSKIVEEIRGILHENDKKLLSFVKGILKEVEKKKEKVKESYINVMSYPRAQDPSKIACCLHAQVLVDNGATLSFTNEKFAQKLPLKYTLRKFVITFREGEVCLDLRLAHGMSFKTHLQVIDAETTYDILLVMDFMQEKYLNSQCYRRQQVPRKGIEIDRHRFIHDRSF
jgi:hypothetical protein